MSWMIGACGPDAPEILSHIHLPAPRHTFSSPFLHVLAGGPDGTCCGGSLTDDSTAGDSGWLVVGIGLRLHDGYSTLISPGEWRSLLVSPHPDLSCIEGHYAALRWKGHVLDCFTDVFGLRMVYFSRRGDTVMFSTRADWLSRLMGGTTINFREFGSHWMLFNQHSYASLLDGITRTGPKAVVRLSGSAFEMQHEEWSLPDSPSREEELTAAVASILNIRLRDGQKFTVGVSGGIDSRVLLALALTQRREPLDMIVYGHPDEPDVVIARQIAGRIGLRQEYLHEEIPTAEECLRRLSEFVPGNYLTAPASSVIKLGYYSAMHSQHRFLLDGGMGEIVRRQYLKHLAILGKRKLLRKDAAGIVQFLEFGRAPVFTGEAVATMQEGILQETQRMLETMPDPSSVSTHDYVDLMAVRYRFPNFGGYEQCRIDGQVASISPYLQPSVVRFALGLPLRERRNGKLFRRLVRTHAPALARYPLVKGGTTVPFCLGSLTSTAWMRLQTRLRMHFVDPTPAAFLHTIEPFVQDIARSSSVRTYGAYDHTAILRLVDGFYRGQMELTRELDWWVAFEVWRTSLRQ